MKKLSVPKGQNHCREGTSGVCALVTHVPKHLSSTDSVPGTELGTQI